MTIQSRLKSIIGIRWEAEGKSGQKDVNDIINWYHDVYIPEIKAKADAALLMLAENSETMDTSEFDSIDYAGMAFQEIKSKAQSAASILEAKVIQVLQKAGKIPINESIKEEQFEKYQTIFAGSFPIMMENESGVFGVASWNDEKSMKNGTRVLPLTDNEIRGIKASVGF